jgi:hypothetical protein
MDNYLLSKVLEAVPINDFLVKEFLISPLVNINLILHTISKFNYYENV